MAWFGSRGMLGAYAVLLTLAMGIFFMSCEKKSPAVNENLVETFVDIRVMEQTLGTDSPETRVARRDILRKHGFTLESFKSSVDAVLADKDLWVPFQKAVVARIDTLLHIESAPANAKGAKK